MLGAGPEVFDRLPLASFSGTMVFRLVKSQAEEPEKHGNQHLLKICAHAYKNDGSRISIFALISLRVSLATSKV